jgi:hypothetical protein
MDSESDATESDACCLLTDGRGGDREAAVAATLFLLIVVLAINAF